MKQFRGRPARRHKPAQAAFTRAELAALIGALALLVVVVLPALAITKARAQRLTCVSNLRELGQSFASWSSEHGNRLPSQVNWKEGGAYYPETGLHNNAYWQFACISNHVRTPRIYVCPADAVKREASTFDFVDPNGGFLQSNYRDNALSYIIGHPITEGVPDILSGDRNLTASFTAVSCPYWTPTKVILRVPANSASWTDALHAGSGNVVLSDGRVEQLSSAGLRQRLAEGTSESSPEFHYLTP